MQLEHEAADVTEKLDTPHEYTPWVVIDGEHDKEIET